jgi:hypothetical protein
VAGFFMRGRICGAANVLLVQSNNAQEKTKMKRTLMLATVLLGIPRISTAEASANAFTMTAVNGAVRVESKDMTATAPKVVYDADAGELKLEGSAKVPVTLHKSGHDFSARALNVSLKSGTAVARSLQYLEICPARPKNNPPSAH